MCASGRVIYLLCLRLFLYFPEHLDPVNVKIAELREALESVTAEQKYLKARDARHRHSKPLNLIILSHEHL